MTNIVMPDFEQWAYSLIDKKDKVMELAVALKQSFDQGYSLGLRDMLTNTQEWWEPLDNDRYEQDRLDKLKHLYNKEEL